MESKLKLDILETHDRLLHFQKQDFQTAECIDDLLKQKPFGDHGFYVFCHPRTDDDGARKRYIWQPRLTKPKAQTNSALYKVKPGSDVIKVIWVIPPREMWASYAKGSMFENEMIDQSIQLFQFDRDVLEKPEEDDPTPQKAQEILFEYQPQLFKRDTLPKELQSVWDRKMRERAKLQSEASSQAASLTPDDNLP